MFYLKTKHANNLIHAFDFDSFRWKLVTELEEDYNCKYTCTVLLTKNFTR